ncbi:hypothetical protein LJC04_06585 [Ruminococcaceae bacterium OttesenSCG-928-O06]|nr:hypothetical protein [Ruminococcaceae bacterium OttesenSCG-928-O06]
MNKYKRMAVLLLALVLLAGCKRSNIAQNFGAAIEDWAPAQTDDAKKNPSDIVALEDADFSEELGFTLAAFPSSDGLVPYRFYAIDGWLAQVEYQAPEERVLVLRIARTRSTSLFSTYEEPHYASDETILMGDTEVRLQTSADGCAMATWKRGDFQYLLHSNKRQGMFAAGEVERMVQTLRAEEKTAQSS